MDDRAVAAKIPAESLIPERLLYIVGGILIVYTKVQAVSIKETRSGERGLVEK
jgi:hypothetical protein